MEDLYSILGVFPNATADEIKQRFRFLAQAYHPDKFASDEHRKQAEEQFKKINDAYQTLSDSEKRAKYDFERLVADALQNQETSKSKQGAGSQSYSRPAPTPSSKVQTKTSQTKPNTTFPVLLGIGLLAVCGFISLCFSGLPLLSTTSPTDIPAYVNTVTPYKTIAPRPTNTKIFIPPTARPTLTFTPTPISFDGQIIISEKYPGDGKWEVFVEKILFADKMANPILGNIDKAGGRFAIIFLQATNRGLSRDFYCVCSELDIQDADGNRYEVHLSATQSAQAIYGLDRGHANPDETLHTVAVFDISLQSSYYMFVPGILYNSESSGLMLNIP